MFVAVSEQLDMTVTEKVKAAGVIRVPTVTPAQDSRLRPHRKDSLENVEL